MDEYEIIAEVLQRCGEAMRELEPHFREGCPSSAQAMQVLGDDADMVVEEWLKTYHFNRAPESATLSRVWCRFYLVQKTRKEWLHAYLLFFPSPRRTVKVFLRHVLLEIWSKSHKGWLGPDRDLGLLSLESFSTLQSGKQP
jgi:hypothetical protein